ncbi:hypothetical protein PCE1_004291 [Barthelona sp. PCE]
MISIDQGRTKEEEVDKSVYWGLPSHVTTDMQHLQFITKRISRTMKAPKLQRTMESMSFEYKQDTLFATDAQGNSFLPSAVEPVFVLVRVENATGSTYHMVPSTTLKMGLLPKKITEDELEETIHKVNTTINHREETAFIPKFLRPLNEEYRTETYLQEDTGAKGEEFDFEATYSDDDEAGEIGEIYLNNEFSDFEEEDEKEEPTMSVRQLKRKRQANVLERKPVQKMEPKMKVQAISTGAVPRSALQELDANLTLLLRAGSKKIKELSTNPTIQESIAKINETSKKPFRLLKHLKSSPLFRQTNKRTKWCLAK